MTFCEEKGWKVGDKFITKGRACFTKGSIVELYEDDDSSIPLFKLISGDCGGFRCRDGEPGAYEHISAVEKIEDCMNNSRKVGALIDSPETWEQMCEGDVVEFVGPEEYGTIYVYRIGSNYTVSIDEFGDVGPEDEEGDVSSSEGETSDRCIFKYVSLAEDVDNNSIEETTTNLLLSVLIDNANQCNGHLQSQINRPTFEQSLELCKLIQEYLEDTTDWTGFCEARWCNDGSGDITAVSWWGQGEHILGHQDRLIVSWD